MSTLMLFSVIISVIALLINIGIIIYIWSKNEAEEFENPHSWMSETDYHRKL